ncbi:hypothetical protein HMPREF0083_00077 [Aneurinibacillus aneurinilyticus ATCC 12856]|uniref:Uncharacterized protein n=1 Tax=Aneurinibacillus aneurinilyticus ATCC 12856 TaxID=649747 RepID=U1XBA8_ANEAE|nr:hypothetical protein HMPREF0083_00077 [Aneurinibacillus aneurinilyticus ATCC 12856]
MSARFPIHNIHRQYVKFLTYTSIFKFIITHELTGTDGRDSIVLSGTLTSAQGASTLFVYSIIAPDC